jgi:hypothetical protein
MADRIFRCTNGVSFGARYTVQTTDVAIDAVSAVAEVIELTVTAGATAGGSVNVQLRGATPVAISVLISDDTAAEVATQIAAGTYPGWTASATDAVVTFTATDAEAKTGTNSISGGTTGVTGTFEITTPGVDAEDAIPGSVTFLFKGNGDSVVSYPLVANVMIVNSSDVHQAASDVKLSYPANGTIKVEDGSTFKLVAGQKISVLAQRADIIAE